MYDVYKKLYTSKALMVKDVNDNFARPDFFFTINQSFNQALFKT